MTAITESKDEKDDKKSTIDKKSASQSAEGGSRVKSNFTMKELQYLNKAPKYQYLKQVVDRSKQSATSLRVQLQKSAN